MLLKMSKSSKINNKLEKMAKEREAFEKQVLALEEDMNNLKKGIIYIRL